MVRLGSVLLGVLSGQFRKFYKGLGEEGLVSLRCSSCSNNIRFHVLFVAHFRHKTTTLILISCAQALYLQSNVQVVMLPFPAVFDI